MVTNENWAYTCYKSSAFKASISLGAQPTSENESVKYSFFVNKFHDDALIHQIEFHQIEEAIKHLNSTYQYWEFVDLEKKLHSGGCNTCQAHD